MMHYGVPVFLLLKQGCPFYRTILDCMPPYEKYQLCAYRYAELLTYKQSLKFTF